MCGLTAESYASDIEQSFTAYSNKLKSSKLGWNQISRALSNQISSAYVGVRYGKQLLSGDPLLKQSAIFGLVGEFRSGILKGLRLYYDRHPKIRVKDNDITPFMFWDRFIVGYSFSRKFFGWPFTFELVLN